MFPDTSGNKLKFPRQLSKKFYAYPSHCFFFQAGSPEVTKTFINKMYYCALCHTNGEWLGTRLSKVER